MCFLRVPRIRRVGGKRVQTPRRGLIPRHRRQIFSLPNNTLNIPHIQCGISDGATVHQAFGWASWMLRLHSNQWNKDPTRSVWQECPMRKACGDIHSCSVQSTSSAVTGTPNRRHPLIPRVALRSVRLQRPPVNIVTLQLHASNVVAVVLLPRSHRGIRRVQYHAHRQHSSPRCGLPCAGR
ncbi:hypothetical protein TcG_10898 [Trypanosoma cruzi]|nr:hypothetical protein TcG_10898 [Trypanosoma cruzi]